MNKLSFNININNIINFKDSKKKLFLNLLKTILIAEQEGVDSITINLQENNINIKEKYIDILKKTIQTCMNIEMIISDKMLDMALKIKPNFCYFIPKKNNKNIIKNGLDIINNFNEISLAINLLNKNGIKVALFIDPDLNQIDFAINAGCYYINLNTCIYSLSKNNFIKNFQFNKIKNSVIYAKKRGLIVNVGYGLNYKNIKKINTINQINKFNIGHSIINEGIFIGLKKAIQKMLLLIK